MFSMTKHVVTKRTRAQASGRLRALLAGGVSALVLGACASGGSLAGGNNTSTSTSTSTSSPVASSTTATTDSTSGGSSTTTTGEPTTAPASSAAVLPNWVTPGLVLDYLTDEDSGYTAIRDTTTVESVSQGVVSGQTQTLGVGTDKTYDWTCSAQGYCPHGEAAFHFWVDPVHPLGSLKGQGLPYEYLGVHSLYDPENRQTYSVGILHYSNATGSVRNSTFYEVGTGLVIEADAVIDGLVTEVWYESTGSA